MWNLFVLCAVWVAAGTPFAETTPGVLPARASYMAPDLSAIAALRTSFVSIPRGIAPEGKTDGLPRARSTFSLRRPDAVSHKEDPRPRRTGSDQLLQDLHQQFVISRAFATAA